MVAQRLWLSCLELGDTFSNPPGEGKFRANLPACLQDAPSWGSSHPSAKVKKGPKQDGHECC
jgi:hypothetical protein